MRTIADSPTKDCTVRGCGNPLRAKGLCSTHYNQAMLSTKRHARVSKFCHGCGVLVDRERRSRGATAHCSELCRQWSQFGAWSSPLPPDHWARMYGKACPFVPMRSVACAWCDTGFLTRNGGVRFCARACQRRAKRAARRAREFNAPGRYTWAEVTRLWLAFDKACAYCRAATPLVEIQAEHVVALSRGGRNDLANLLPSCGPCNSDKRDLPLSEWNADRERRHLTPVTTTWDDDDPRYAHLVERTNLRTAA